MRRRGRVGSVVSSFTPLRKETNFASSSATSSTSFSLHPSPSTSSPHLFLNRYCRSSRESKRLWRIENALPRTLLSPPLYSTRRLSFVLHAINSNSSTDNIRNHYIKSVKDVDAASSNGKTIDIFFSNRQYPILPSTTLVPLQSSAPLLFLRHLTTNTQDKKEDKEVCSDAIFIFLVPSWLFPLLLS